MWYNNVLQIVLFYAFLQVTGSCAD